MPSANGILALGVVMPVLGAFFIYLRLWARTRRTKYSWDDLMSVLGFLLLLVMSIILVIGVATTNLGVDVSLPSTSSSHNATDSANNSDLPTQSVTMRQGHYQFLVLILLGPALGITKLSLLFFYRRIFRGSTFNVASWVSIVAVIMWILFFFVLLLLLCGTHISYLYTPYAQPNERPSCMDYEPIALSMAGTDVLLDLVVLVLPIYWTLGIHIDTASKLLVSVVFAFGAVAVAASLGRLIGLVILYKGGWGLSEQIAFVMFISVLELGLAVIATCLPTLGHLLPDPARKRIMQYIDNIIPTKLRRRSRNGTTATSKRASYVTSGWTSRAGGQSRLSRVDSSSSDPPQVPAMAMIPLVEEQTFFSTTSLTGSSAADNSDDVSHCASSGVLPITQHQQEQQQQATVPVAELEGSLPAISGAQIVELPSDSKAASSSSPLHHPNEEASKAIIGATIHETPAGGILTPRSILNSSNNNDARPQQSSSSLLMPPGINSELQRDENSTAQGSGGSSTLVSARDARMRTRARREEAERQRQQQQQQEDEDGHIHVSIQIMQTEERRDSADTSADSIINSSNPNNPFLSPSSVVGTATGGNTEARDSR